MRYEYKTTIHPAEDMEIFSGEMYSKRWEPVSFIPLPRNTKLESYTCHILATFRRSLDDMMKIDPPHCGKCAYFSAMHEKGPYCVKGKLHVSPSSPSCGSFVMK